MISFVALGDSNDASNGLSDEAVDALETAEVTSPHSLEVGSSYHFIEAKRN